MVHITDAVLDGHQSVMIRSTDTDVLVFRRPKGIVGLL